MIRIAWRTNTHGQIKRKNERKENEKYHLKSIVSAIFKKWEKKLWSKIVDGNNETHTVRVNCTKTNKKREQQHSSKTCTVKLKSIIVLDFSASLPWRDDVWHEQPSHSFSETKYSFNSKLYTNRFFFSGIFCLIVKFMGTGWMKHCHEKHNSCQKKLHQQSNIHKWKAISFSVFLLMCAVAAALVYFLFRFFRFFVHDFGEFTRDEIFQIPMFYMPSMTFTIYADGIQLLRAIILYFIRIWLPVPSNTTSTPVTRKYKHSQRTIRANYSKQQTKNTE